jgi:hypothetical protein
MFKSKPAAGAAEAAEIIIGKLSSVYHLSIWRRGRVEQARAYKDNSEQGPREKRIRSAAIQQTP